MKNPLELLSPAANLHSGIAAIRAGADAIYIGGPDFGARRDAANSMDDIAELVKFAHGYRAKVYLAMNTIIFDDELKNAREIACRAWKIGVDALIVQDMAFLEMDLPSISLHASTQTFNMKPERVKFLEEAGFSRVILERGATLDQIKAIRRETNVELEAFVHGAICVCYSGQCYLGHAVCGRGGNRGGCAQPCRSKYDLTDSRGNRLIENSHLLSVSDLNLSGRLEDLAAAGVTSFKIEGRLKDESYVVNNTAYYSGLLNELGKPRASSGKTTYDFEPDPARSFSRGFTEYYIDGPRPGMASGESAKATGEYIGKVSALSAECFEMFAGAGNLNNGDGICFAGRDGEILGTNINKASGSRVYPNKMDGITAGTKIYRNYDRLFRPDGSSAERLIDIGIMVNILPEKIILTALDSDGHSVQTELSNNFDAARNGALAAKSITESLSKSGGTIFRITGVEIDSDGNFPFIPASTINAARRELLGRLLKERTDNYTTPQRSKEPAGTNLPISEALDYRENVANRLAEEFYRKHGVKDIERALETRPDEDYAGKEVMRTPFCIRREAGCCLVKDKFPAGGGEKLPVLSNILPGPLYLENNGMKLELRFHCETCEMSVIFLGK